MCQGDWARSEADESRTMTTKDNSRETNRRLVTIQRTAASDFIQIKFSINVLFNWLAFCMEKSIFCPTSLASIGHTRRRAAPPELKFKYCVHLLEQSDATQSLHKHKPYEYCHFPRTSPAPAPPPVCVLLCVCVARRLP